MGWQDAQAAHRHFPSSRSNRGRRAVFDVRSAFGTYTVKCRGASSGSFIEIHGTTDDGRGIVASFEMGGLEGIMLIAGSRKGLAEVVADADAEADDGEEDEEEEEEEEDEEEEDEEEKDKEQDDDDDNNDDEDDTMQVHRSDDRNTSSSSVIKASAQSKALASPPSSTNFAPPPPSHSATPFEKNTFRTPKFWLRYRARDTAAGGRAVADADGNNMGFIEFDGNACRGFKGVVSGGRFGENMAFEGWKVKGRGTPARWTWKEFLREGGCGSVEWSRVE